MPEASQKRTREQIEADIAAMQKKGAERDLADAKMREALQRATKALEASRRARDQKPDPTAEADAEKQRKEAEAIAERERAREEAVAQEEARVAAGKKQSKEKPSSRRPREMPPVKLLSFPPENPAGTMPDLETEKKDPKTFSPQYIGERITPLLRKVATVVRDPEVTGEDKEMTIKTTIEKWGGTVSIQAILENKHNGIGIKSYEIEAPWMVKKLAEAFIGTELDKVSKLLKSYIENEEQREVAKMEIVNGELQVTFGTTKPEKETSPTTPPPTEDTPDRGEEERLKAKEIARLKAFIENAERQLEENKTKEKVIIRKLLEIQKKKGPIDVEVV